MDDKQLNGSNSTGVTGRSGDPALKRSERQAENQHWRNTLDLGLGLAGVTPSAHAKLVTGFKASAQLELRLAEAIERMQEETNSGPEGRRGSPD